MRQNLAYTRDERKPFLQNRFTGRDLRNSICLQLNRFCKIDLPKSIFLQLNRTCHACVHACVCTCVCVCVCVCVCKCMLIMTCPLVQCTYVCTVHASFLLLAQEFTCLLCMYDPVCVCVCGGGGGQC